MEALRFEYQPSEYVIRIDRSKMSEIDFQKLVKWIEIDMLIKEADFDESIQTIGNDMKSHWWERNKSRFVGLE
jgi:hypothetical protein